MESPESRLLYTSPPWLFGNQGLSLLIVAALVGLVFSLFDVAFLAGGLLLVGLAARGWARVALDGVTCERRLRSRRAFHGETVVVETTVTNARWLPLPWAEVWERYPRVLEPDGAVEPSYAMPRSAWVSRGVALWPYRRTTWQRLLRCQQRGAYRFEPPHLRAGDPFGMAERETVSSGDVELLVYPRVVRLRRLDVRLHHPALDVASARSPAADPTRTAALRDYRPDDPLRLIHWPSTARRGDLQVRVLEPATSLRVSLVLDVRGFPNGFYRETLFELAISAVASMAMFLHEQGHPTSVIVNSDPPLVLPGGTSVAHLESILAALARLTNTPGPPLVPWALAHLPRGNSVVLVMSDRAPSIETTLAGVERAGFRVVPMLACTEKRELGRRQVHHLLPGWDLAALLEGRA